MSAIIRTRRLARAILQLILSAISASAAWWMTAPRGEFSQFEGALLGLVVVVRAATFWPLGVYTSVWRYTGAVEIAKLTGAVAAGSGLLGVLIVAGGVHPPLAWLAADALLLGFFLSAVRIVPRVWHQPRSTAHRRRLLVIGAGDAGAMILREIRNRNDSPYAVVGLIDDDPAKHGLQVHGVTVLGGRDRLGEAVAMLRPDEILVAIPSATLVTLRAIVDALQRYRIPIKTLPNIRELPECHVELAQIRPLALEDLLARPVVALDSGPVRDLLGARRVLVTGAGGSIGSELCRQILRTEPDVLVLVERHENALFWVTRELEPLVPSSTKLVPTLLDVTDETGLEALMRGTAPDVVFHAAAHKHVPLLESNAREAVRNNILGTLTLARVAERHRVDRFVLVSTDKAVSPASVMGATKRACELVVQVLMKNSPTRFCAVRFGNVLGSNGSVTQVFLRQIRAGGPVTVTHPDMQRYFMLTSEAVELVTHAAVLAERGTVYTLEMGEPVRVIDLARRLIRLAGYRPDIDITITTTGLRPGERLEESLVDAGEHEQATPVAGIRRTRPARAIARQLVDHELNRLLAMVECDEAEDVRQALARVIALVSPLAPFAAALGVDDNDDASATQAPAAFAG